MVLNSSRLRDLPCPVEGPAFDQALHDLLVDTSEVQTLDAVHIVLELTTGFSRASMMASTAPVPTP